MINDSARRSPVEIEVEEAIITALQDTETSTVGEKDDHSLRRPGSTPATAGTDPPSPRGESLSVV
jgi:hypothetical protein